MPIVIHSQIEGTFAKYIKRKEKNKKLKINNVTYSYIEEINRENKGKEIPTLEEVLDLCKDKIFINIEIKDFQYELAFKIVIDLIKKKSMFNQISISSLRHQYSKIIEEYNKNNEIKIECGYIYYPDVAPNFRMDDLENDSIYKELFDYGVDVICCNSPTKALKYRDKYYKNKNRKKKL